MVGFSKYEFYNKLLGDIILLKITPGVTWTQLKINNIIYFVIILIDWQLKVVPHSLQL